jgi:hypothetical protein
LQIEPSSDEVTGVLIKGKIWTQTHQQGGVKAHRSKPFKIVEGWNDAPEAKELRLPEVRTEVWSCSLPSAFRGSSALPTTCFWTPGHQNYEAMSFFFKLPTFW